jgi:hypothetical protein
MKFPAPLEYNGLWEVNTMDHFIETLGVPVIFTIVYWIINLIKYATNNTKNLRGYPSSFAGLGAVLGVVAFYAVPGIKKRIMCCLRLS